MGEERKLKEVQELMDSLLIETFFLSQVSSSTGILNKTNAIKMKKKIEDNLKRRASQLAASPQDRKKSRFKM